MIFGVSIDFPAGMIYRKKKTKKGAIVGLVLGTLIMTFLGCFSNAYIMLPAYAKAFHWPIDNLIAMGTALNPSIDNMFTFVVFAVVPFNLLKGIIVSLVVSLIYKKIRVILK